MDERFRDRRRQVGRSRGKRRLTVVLVVALSVGAALGFYWLRSSGVFAVVKVSLPVTQNVSEAQIRAVVAPVSGVNLLRVSTQTLEAGLREIPYVRSAHVYRGFPDSLVIDIEEYVPVARVRASDGTEWLVADDGTILAEAGAEAGDLLLLSAQADVRPQVGVVTAPQVVGALRLVSWLEDGVTWPVSVHPVKEVSVLRSGELAIVLQGGGEVRLGDPEQLDEKLTVALEIIDRYLKDGKELEYVDVHVPSRVVAKAR